MSPRSEYLFNPSLLCPIDKEAPEGLRIRPLHFSDYDKGFLEVLSQLTTVGDVSPDAWESRFRSMQATPTYFVVVIEDTKTDRVVASATLVVEYKFIHEAGQRGRVEDVVVHSSQRGKKLGVLLNKVLVFLAKKLKVYKLSLECKDKLISFYEQFGFKKDAGNNFLCQRFDHESKI